jgi:beta-fructofuranosidase
LSISPDGQLRQAPAPQLSKLRGKPVVWRNLDTQNSGQEVQLPGTNSFEILAEINLEKANRVELKLKNGAGNAELLVVRFDGANLIVADAKAPCPLSEGTRKFNLRIFVDRTVLEVFANETACITKTIPALGSNLSLSVHSDAGTADFKLVEVWPMNTIW